MHLLVWSYLQGFLPPHFVESEVARIIPHINRLPSVSIDRLSSSYIDCMLYFHVRTCIFRHGCFCWFFASTKVGLVSIASVSRKTRHETQSVGE